MPRTVHVTAPSRLHLGMLSFGQPDARQFGGVGVMIDAPGMQLRFREAEQLEVHGPLAARALQFTGRMADALGLTHEPPCRIDVIRAPREHVGLGVGTQLGLAVAAGLNRFLDRPHADAAELAAYVGRAKRSAVGTYGFDRGGMIVEAGRSDDERIAPLVCRVELPDAWRFVLICPKVDQGLSGTSETEAFAGLPPVPEQVTERLCRELLLHIVPAARAGRFDEFSAGVYRYGRLAGECFATRQSGPFAGERLANLVEAIREMGVEGVGQSSWGPTLFALFADERQAGAFVRTFRERPDAADLDLHMTSTANHGARVELTDG